jgi:DNA-directed DNA polymerase III PolC
MFTHLHCHSHYSFLRAVPSPEEIVAAAKEHGMTAVALTDTNGLYAAVPFYQAAREAGVKPIVGVTLDVELDGTPESETWCAFREKSRGSQAAAHEPEVEFDARGEGEEEWIPPGAGEAGRAEAPRTGAGYALRAGFEFPRSKSDPTVTWPGPKLVLLAMNYAGYSNLCRLVTERHLTGRAVRIESLREWREGVLALYEAGGQRVAQERERERVIRLKEIFGDALYLEVQHFDAGDGRRLREAARLGRELGVTLAATNSVHFLRPEEHLHHRVLNAIRTGTLLTRVAPPEIVSAEAWFKPAAEMQRAFSAYAETGAAALEATEEIAARCELELPLGRTIFPECAVPEGETPFSYLWKLCFEGARRRYRPLRPEVLSRLTHELEVIDRLHLAPYFLLVWEIVQEAQRRGIPAVARGSAASSMVSYCLGISRVCPLRWGLYFERFLNEERGDIPDIDLDICGARRDELLEWVYRRWGGGERARPAEQRVAMIGSFITMHARLAVREVAKVFGVPPGEVNQFTRRLPHRPVRDILEALRTLPECRALPAHEEPWRTILQLALRLDGFPRHLGIHPCGTVIAARPLTEWVPLEVATKGIVVTQPDMNAVEALGLIKMDLLGQRGLTTMSLALENIRRTDPAGVDFESIPEEDPATCAMLAEGRTMGVFQIESPGLRGLLRALRARTMEDLCLAIAIIRPGAAEYGSKEAFLKRLRGQEAVQYPHPRLEPILRETLGVCVYQEQVMQIAQVAGGLTLAEADLVRRSRAKWADARERERFHAKFMKTAARLGLDARRREETWQMVEKFAGFGFCKAHAATYADLAYRMAYLKAHYPAEFLAAMCSAGAGFYHVSAYVEEAKRWGVAVRGPSVNRSEFEYTTEREESGAAALRIGLMQVKGLRLETIRAILRAREERGGFRSLEDFLARVPAERDEVEALIKCGALDDTGDGARPAMLWRLNLLRTNHRGQQAFAPPQAALFPEAAGAAPRLAIPELQDYTCEQRLAYEQQILEVCVSGHPLDLVEGERRPGEIRSTEVDRCVGRRVTLLGWLITFRHVGTKNFRNMMFATFEDQRGLFEVVLFPEAYERYGRWVYEARMLRVTGRVEADGHVNCEKLEPVNSRS